MVLLYSAEIGGSPGFVELDEGDRPLAFYDASGRPVSTPTSYGLRRYRGRYPIRDGSEFQRLVRTTVATGTHACRRD